MTARIRSTPKRAQAAPDRMSAKDRLVWRLEMDTDIRPIIVLVFLLEERPDDDHLRKWHMEAARRLPRMAARVARYGGRLGMPRWIPDPSFDPSPHIRNVRVPGKGTPAELLRLVEDISQTPFVPNRPLWECHIVEGLEDGKTAYVLKISHAIADGLRLRDLFAQQSPPQTSTAGHRREGIQPEPQPPSPSAPAEQRPLSPRLRRARDAARFGALVVRDVRNPPSAPRGSGDGVARRYFCVDLPMAGLRAAARQADGTVQDALVAGLTDGLHRYNTHWEVDRPRMQVFSPYGRAPLTRHDPSPVGNHWFIVRFEVPAGAPDTGTRIRAARSAVRRVYHRDALDWMGAVARIAPFVPARLLQVAFRHFAGSHDFIISNIPGPRSQIRVAGATAERLYGIAPTLGAALTATSVSYGDTCHVTLNIDPAVVRDPDLLASCLRESLEKVTCND
ncbi:wax ester/triacylglycerol synthase domain-containing protein [Streptomyces longwoodensis]|uniref:wax ester/triacylglycerol synthase domain-containing protein n=1 Tax=Streptomyces longwoodensis TaxID=68231 RepID=UPI0033C509CF